MPALTRGPLPPRVYWVRRALVFGTAILLVVGIARMLGNGSDASDGGAAQLSADTSSTSPSVTEPTTPSATATKQDKKKTNEPDPTPTLAAPTGECAGSDVAITPKVRSAVAGRPVTFVLQLRTLVSEACTWRVAPDSLAVSITSGNDDVWSSRQCRKAIPVRDVVVRQAVTTNVAITWSAKRSDETCSKFTTWAMPGWYHVSAAALGGEPSDLQFELVRPTPATITKTIQPTASASGRPQTHPSGKPSGSQSPH